MKKTVSILLAVLMVISLLPIGALAADETTGFNVSFSVPNGVDAVADMEYTDGGITLPSAGNISTAYDYTFVGWAAAPVSDTAEAPAFYEAGAVFTTDAATTLYALYTYSLGEGGSAGYVLTDIANINAVDNVVITMTYTDGTTWALTNGNGTSKAPVATVVALSGDALAAAPDASLLWNVVGTADGFSIYPAGTTDTWLYCTATNNGVRVGTNANKDFSIDATSGYIKNAATSRYLGVYRTTPDWRCYTNTTGNTADQTLGFYVEAASGLCYTTEVQAPACEHANTVVEGATDATCTTAGYTGDTVCTDCGETVTKGAEIAALGHNYVDNTCTVCGETIADLSGDYYIAAKRSSGNYFYMTSNLGTASTKRYTAVDSGLAELPAVIANGLTDRTFTLTANDDGTYAISVEGQYLGWTSGNSGALVAVDAALALNVTATETGAYTIVDSASGRNLSLNTTNAYFAFYTGTQINDLYLIPVSASTACDHATTTVTGAVAATCTEAGYTGDTVCATCGELITEGAEIAALGHTNEDGDFYCDVCGTQIATDSEYKKTTVINVGDNVVLVNEEAVVELSAISTTSTRYGIGTEFSGAPVGLMPLTVVAGAAEGTYAFQTADGLYLVWLSGNSLNTSETLDANSSWTVSFDAGNAVIANSADATRTVRWNKTSPRFACYTSGQADVQLYKLVTADACQHGETTVTGAVDATCTEAGYTGDTVCNLCGDTVTFGTAIDALGHDTIVDAAVAATCVKGGLTEGSHCSRCDEISAQKIVTAAGHTYVDGVCSVCGEAEVFAPEAAADIIAAAYALEKGDALPYNATLTGVITEINTAYSETYLNITVTIAVAGCETQPIMCYRLAGEGADALAVGDTITVSGLLVNYNDTIEFAAGCALVSVVKPLPKEYCLVGNINGANYGCEEDYENVGEYIFVDGTLTTSFTTDSYIFIKTTDNANWYLTETYCTDTTGTFVLNAPEKMLVPANVELTFTLVENEDGSLTLSYEKGAEIPVTPSTPDEPVAPTYYVAGSFNNWNAADEAYVMNANEDGTYNLTFDVVAGEVQLKVTAGSWADGKNWGDNGQNVVVNATTDGAITVTFNPADYSISVTGDCLGEVEEEPMVIDTLHVVGVSGLTGFEWNVNENVMTNNDGIYTITFTGVAAGTYDFKFAANGAWDLNWASGIEAVSGETQTAWFNALGNSSVTVAEDDSTVTMTFDTTTMDFITGEGATMCVVVEAPAIEPSKQPTVALKYPTLTFEDVILMNVYFSASDLDDVVEMGLLTYTESVTSADISTANSIIPGYSWSEADGLYCATTGGIAAKDLGDEIYFAVYAKLNDGTYYYTRVVSYSPSKYAYASLSTGSASMRPIVVAMLNYGAAAQTYFNYKTDALVNANLTDEQKGLVEAYRSDMINAVAAATAEKQGDLVMNGGFSRRYPTVSFEGAFCINYYCIPSAQPVDGITMYYWDQAAFDANDVLTIENATDAIPMVLGETGEYCAVVEGIAAKDLDKGVYVAFVYSDGTTTYYSGVLAYSIGTYCGTQAAGTGTTADLAKATAVYGYYANQLFNK